MHPYLNSRTYIDIILYSTLYCLLDLE